MLLDLGITYAVVKSYICSPSKITMTDYRILAGNHLKESSCPNHNPKFLSLARLSKILI